MRQGEDWAQGDGLNLVVPIDPANYAKPMGAQFK